MKTSIKEYLQEHDKAQINDLAAALGKEGSKDFRDLVKTISLMERRHELKFEDDGSLRLAQKKAPVITLKGIFHAHKNGFGFVSLEGEAEDLFVGRNDVNHAIDGDTVEIVITKVADRNKGTAAEAKIIDVLEHSIKTVVGQIVLDEEKPRYAGYIRSKNQKISQLIYVKKPAIQLEGTEILKVEIDQYPSRKHNYFVATVRDVVGHVTDPGIDVLEVLESMDIVSEFPEEVLKEADQVPDAPSAKDLEGRLDLRDEITFTIDGAGCSHRRCFLLCYRRYSTRQGSSKSGNLCLCDRPSSTHVARASLQWDLFFKSECGPPDPVCHHGDRSSWQGRQAYHYPNSDQYNLPNDL